jgi:Protein of unknown function (DUF3455)
MRLLSEVLKFDRCYGFDHFAALCEVAPPRSAFRAGKECTMYRQFAPPFLSLLIVACAGLRQPAAEVRVPDKLKPQSNETLAMIVRAKGVQVYECRAGKDQAGAYEWAFVAPEADLFDAGGNRLGRHYAGPRWESTDGSTIVGTLKERADAPLANAIPWLLLTVKSAGPEGSFSKVTSIQRVNTVGGVAPKEGCSQSAAGTTARVNYTADYYFFSTK